jgi:hypothetical protein
LQNGKTGTDLDLTFRKKEDIITRRIAGETLLVPVYSDLANMESIFMLDAVAAFIWERMDGKKSLKHIRDNVLDAFDVKEERAETDISEFIKKLLDANLIVEAR